MKKNSGALCEMNETWDAIFSAITPFLCVLLACGVILLIWRRPKLNAAVWAVAACAVFTLIWRTTYQLESSRYAMILLLPAIVTGAYALWNAHAFFPERCQRFAKYLRWILLFSVPLIFLAKSWNISPYRNSLKELAEIARDDAKNYSCVSFAGIDIHDESFEYYSGIRPSGILPFNLSIRKNSDWNFLKPLSYIVDSDNVLYLVAQTDINKEKELAAELGRYPGRFVKLGEKWVNNRKKKKYLLFRYEHRQQHDAMTARIQEGSSEKNLLSNGSFEKVVPVPDYMVDFCRQRQVTFFQKSDIIIPGKVELSGLGGCKRRAEIEATGINTIDGKYSMRMKNASRFMITDPLPPQNYKFSVLVKALSKAELQIHAFLYDPKFKYDRCIATRQIPGDNSVWKYEFTIPQDVLMPCKFIRIVFTLNYGEVLLDNVRLKKL